LARTTRTATWPTASPCSRSAARALWAAERARRVTDLVRVRVRVRVRVKG